MVFFFFLTLDGSRLSNNNCPPLPPVGSGTLSSSPSSSGSSSDEDLSDFQYLFIFAQILHGIGAAALVTLGTTLMDESVAKNDAPMYIGIFEASFVLGPALG